MGHGWTDLSEHQKVLFIYTAEDVLTNLEIVLSAEDGDHGNMKDLDYRQKIRYKIRLSKTSCPTPWTRFPPAPLRNSPSLNKSLEI